MKKRLINLWNQKARDVSYVWKSHESEIVTHGVSKVNGPKVAKFLEKKENLEPREDRERELEKEKKEVYERKKEEFL